MSNVIITGSAGTPVTPRARVIFSCDATASREATWAIACELQAKMFIAAAPIGVLDVQLVYHRGGDQCRASKWCSSGDQLAQLMHTVTCEGGYTQIARVLRHTLRETEKTPVQALTYIGDAMEEELDELAGVAAELGRLRTPVHTFLEGRDAKATAAFRLISLRSGGQFHQFGTSTPQAIAQLAAKLTDVARDAALLTHRK